MRSSLFKGLALMSALSVLVALVVHAGCSKPVGATAEPASASASAQPIAQAPAALVSASASAAPEPAKPDLPPSLVGAGNGSGGSNGFMGASKSGAIFHGSDFGKGRAEAGTPQPPPQQQQAPVQR